MLSDYMSLKKQTSNASSKSHRKMFHDNFEPVKTMQSLQMKSHVFDRKDPWNWKFPQRCDTMSNSTLDEDRDQVKIRASHKMRTSRNQSLNLLSTDINSKFNRSFTSI